MLAKPPSNKLKGEQLVAIPPHLLTRCCYTTLISTHQNETLTYLCSKLPCLFQPGFGGELVSEGRSIWQAELNPGYQAAGHAARSVSTYRHRSWGFTGHYSHGGEQSSYSGQRRWFTNLDPAYGSQCISSAFLSESETHQYSDRMLMLICRILVNT